MNEQNKPKHCTETSLCWKLVFNVYKKCYSWKVWLFQSGEHIIERLQELSVNNKNALPSTVGLLTLISVIDKSENES